MRNKIDIGCFTAPFQRLQHLATVWRAISDNTCTVCKDAHLTFCQRERRRIDLLHRIQIYPPFPANLLREPKKEFLVTFLLASRPLLLALALAWAMGSPSCGLEGSCRAAVTAPRTSASIIGPAIAKRNLKMIFRESCSCFIGLTVNRQLKQSLKDWKCINGAPSDARY